MLTPLVGEEFAYSGQWNPLVDGEPLLAIAVQAFIRNVLIATLSAVELQVPLGAGRLTRLPKHTGFGSPRYQLFYGAGQCRALLSRSP
jgi:hypothetical protein